MGQKRPTGRRARAAEAERRRRARRRAMWLTGLAGVAIAALAVVVLAPSNKASETSSSSTSSTSSSSVPTTTSKDIAGLQTFSDLSRNHVQGPVDYPQSPPVGGDHDPLPQTCGFYGQRIANEHAVHSMEHGAVWITYRPDLSDADIDVLRNLGSQPLILVSPYPGLPARVVASAWGRQVRLQGVHDPRLLRFIEQFRAGPDAPERGGACAGTSEAAGG